LSKKHMVLHLHEQRKQSEDHRKDNSIHYKQFDTQR
jgi:hypothetical protein